MLDVVSEAVHRLGRDQWWVSVHESLDHMADHEAAAYAADVALDA